MLQSLRNVHHWKKASGVRHEIAAGRLRQVHQVLAGLWQEAVACIVANVVHAVASERCTLHPAAAWFASPTGR